MALDQSVQVSLPEHGLIRRQKGFVLAPRIFALQEQALEAIAHVALPIPLQRSDGNAVCVVYSSPVCYTYHGFRSATQKPEAVACQSGFSTLGARATAFLSALFDFKRRVYRFCFPRSDAPQ